MYKTSQSQLWHLQLKGKLIFVSLSRSGLLSRYQPSAASSGGCLKPESGKGALLSICPPTSTAFPTQAERGGRGWSITYRICDTPSSVRINGVGPGRPSSASLQARSILLCLDCHSFKNFSRKQDKNGKRK